ncbi:unnamed protein product, partial [Prorocentrum cordatum]
MTAGVRRARQCSQARWVAFFLSLSPLELLWPSTRHTEWGCTFALDLNECFFNPRLAAERQRVCKLVAPGERVLVLFSGAGAWPVLLAARSRCSQVVAVEANPKAHAFALENVQANGVAGAVRSLLADADALADLGLGTFDRVVAPRPLGSATAGALAALAGAVAPGGHAHVYGFVPPPIGAGRELPPGSPEPGGDLDGLLALGSGEGRAFGVERVARCPRRTQSAGAREARACTGWWWTCGAVPRIRATGCSRKKAVGPGPGRARRGTGALVRRDAHLLPRPAADLQLQRHEAAALPPALGVIEGYMQHPLQRACWGKM